MTTNPFPTAEPEERLDAVIAEYLESVERGGSPEPGVWLQKYPELAPDLELFFAAETRFDGLVGPLRAAGIGSTVPPAPTLPADPPLKTIKDYDLLAEIGRGGMGVIYKARQRSLNRLVAIKMIRSAEWATPAERMRFRWEAEAIGALDHPNIVPIYEIGEVPSGDGTQLPFFSMKLIDGENLAQGRDHFRNDWRAIARLTSILARAVEHAHQRGILHRDLKPANVLLGSSADAPAHGAAFVVGAAHITPHISDFGLAAKAHQPRGQTLVGTIVGTPSYLAPELASGRTAATIASDAYAIGAILYEILTGEPPFRAATPLETIQMLTTTAVKWPRKVNPAIPLDLETICLKCLQPEPQQRYPSAGKLADDLDLFLAGRPIGARPVGTLAAFRRWCRRQPVIAGLGAALLLSVAIGMPLIVWNWRRAVDHERTAQNRLGEVIEERERADGHKRTAENRLEEVLKERERADSGFRLAHGAFEDLFRMIGDPDSEALSESDALNKELLERGLAYYRDFVARRKNDPGMRRELASAMFRIATITARIKTHREAVGAYDQTIAFLRSVLEEYPDDTSLLTLLSRTLTNRGTSLMQLDQADEAIRSSDAAVEVWSRLPAGGPDLAQAQRSLGIAMMDRGLAFQRNGDWARALDSFQRALAVLTGCNAPETVQGPLVHCRLNIANVHTQFNRLEPARQNARAGKQIAERMYKQFPNTEETQLLMGQSQHTTAKIELKAGNRPGASAALQAALQFFEGLHRAKPRTTQYKRCVALVYSDLATVEKQQNRPAEALKALEEAALRFRELTDADGESRADRTYLGGIAFRIGDSHREAKDYPAAARAFEESRTHRRFLSDRRPTNIEVRMALGRTCFYLGASLINAKRNKDALAPTDEAIEIYQLALQQKPGDPGPRKTLSSALGNRAIALRNLGRPDDALAATEERMKLWPNSANELYDAALDIARTYDLLSTNEESKEARGRAVKSAVRALQQAREAGLPDLERVRTEPTFTKIRESDEFRALLKENG